MRNNSHSPGCMRRLPASHSCHPRSVQWIRDAAAVCESPAASRAARISAGSGLRDGEPPRERLGWAAMSGDGANLNFPAVGQPVLASAQIFGFGLEWQHAGEHEAAHVLTEGGGFVAEFVGLHDDLVDVGAGDFVFHFFLQPLFPEARLWRIHTLNNTRIACNCKNFLQKICEAATPPHNA